MLSTLVAFLSAKSDKGLDLGHMGRTDHQPGEGEGVEVAYRWNNPVS